jgi:hypothetical protein
MSRIPHRRGNAVSRRNRREYVAYLDDLFRAILMTTHGAVRMPCENGRGFYWYGRCLRCSRAGPLYVSHIEPKGQYPHLRWREGNAFAFCFYCHMHWWHKNPRDAWAFREAQLGASASETLALAARSGKGMRSRALDVCAIEHYLRQRLRALAPRGVEGMEF